MNDKFKFPIHHFVALEDYDTLSSLLHSSSSSSSSSSSGSSNRLEDQIMLLSTFDDKNLLPIHVASSIPTSSSILRLLLDIHPHAASIKDFNNNLPIHYYTSMITNDSILSIKLLFNAYPDSIKERDCNNELIIHDLLRHLEIDDQVADLVLLFVSLYPESVLEPDCYDQLPIHVALEKNASLRVIEGLLKLAPSLIMQETKPYKNLLLHYYLKTGSKVRLDVVKCLIEKNSSQLTQKDWSCCLPIHLSMKCGSPEDVVITIIRAYTKYEIDNSVLDDRDGDGNNIIMLAIKHNYSLNVLKAIFNEKYKNKSETIENMLTFEEARPTMSRDVENRNYFYLLGQYQAKSNDMLEYLIRLFPNDLNEQSNDGSTALHAAVQNQPSYLFVKSLLDASPSISKIKNNAGCLPIHLAAVDPLINPEIIKLIGFSFPAGCIHSTPDDGNLPIHIAASHAPSVEIIRNLLLCNPSAAAVKNKQGQYPIILAIQSSASLSVVVAILFAYPLKLEEFKGLINTEEYDLKVLSFVVSLLKERRQLSTVHIHLVGNSYAGKTSLRGELRETLGKSWMSHQIGSLFRSRKTSVENVCRTIGMECDIFDDESRRWIIHDYGGDKEFHINHSKILATPGSIYVIVVGLYDPVKHILLTCSEVLLRYRYWVKYIYSIADDTPTIITLINFKKKSDELDKDFAKTVEQLIITEQKNWIESNIKFLGEPIKLDVINRDEVFNQVNILMLEAVTSLSINKFPVSVIINECLKRKFEWPRAITELQLIHEIIFPMLQEFIASSDVPESFVDPLCSLLSQFIVDRMEKLGEILIVEGSNGVNWTVTDPNWLTETVLGKIFYPSDEQKKPIVKIQNVSPLSSCTIDLRADTRSEFNFITHHFDYLPALLEGIGVCIRVPNNQLQLLEHESKVECTDFKPNGSNAGVSMWFPSFIDINAGDKDCILLPNANRVCIRRFRLQDPVRQIFPPGFFPFLFVNVAGLERSSTNLKFFNDGMELVANYKYANETEPFIKHRSKLQIIINRSHDYFDVIVAGVKVEQGDSYVWNRLQDVRNLIYNPSPSAWQKNISLNEYCVHPEDKDKEISLQNTLKSLLNPESKEEMLSYFYGELDNVAVEEVGKIEMASSIHNEKSGLGLGLEEFYKKSTVSFQHLHEAIQSQNAIISRLKGLASEIASTHKEMSMLIDDSNIKAKTIIRDVVSLKNGLPDAKRIDDDDDDDDDDDVTNNMSDNHNNDMNDNLSNAVVLSTNESTDEIERVQNKAQQLVHVSNSMKRLLRKLENACDDSNELVRNSLDNVSMLNSITSTTTPAIPIHKQLMHNSNDNLMKSLLSQLAIMNSRMDYVSENVEKIMSSSNKISATIQSMIAKNSDIPALPLILIEPPKGNDWRNIKKWCFKKSRLFFICPITLRVGAGGLKGKGYKIYEPKDWLIKIIPLLKISVIILQLAVRSLGIPFTIPIPNFADGDDAYLSNLNGALDNQLMIYTSGDVLTDTLNRGIVGIDQLSDTKLAKTLVHDIIDDRNKVTNHNDVSENVSGVNDNAYAALGQLLRNAGDPLPNNRPIYSGLVGPIVSKCDGTVSWVSEEAVTVFHEKGRKAFYNI